jgi:hypothetical protein
MTNVTLEDGYEQTIRNGPKPSGGWKKRPIITRDDGTVITVTLTGPVVEPPPPPTGTFPPVTTLKYAATPSRSLPAKLSPITDPTFGTKITRITDAGKRHGYSRRQPWSPDEKYLLIEKGGAQLLDGQTYAPIKSLSGVPGGPQWLDNVTLVGVSGSSLRTLNVETGATGTLYTFPTTVTMGGEGRPSDDCRYFAVAGGGKLAVYDRTTDSLRDTSIPASPNWVGMSRTGKYVLVGNNTRGTARGQGTELYDRATLSFIRNITENYSHSDPGLDVDGKDVLAMCGQEYPRLYLLDAGGERKLSPFPTAFGNSHVSCWGRPGYATYSTYKPDSSGRPGSDQVFSLKMDGSGTGHAWGIIGDTGDTYESEPQAVVSPSGTRVLFASTWGTGSVYAFVASA